jgi:shikimate kinase
MSPGSRESPRPVGRVRRVVLIGQMGSGKTTVGGLLATRLGWPFRDNDAALETRTGRTAAAIAQDGGLERLHELERETFAELVAPDEVSIIAAPASVIEGEILNELDEATFVVWLQVSPAVLAARSEASRHRPLPSGDRHQRFENLVAERDEAYEDAADLVVEADDLTPREIERIIGRALEAWARSSP